VPYNNQQSPIRKREGDKEKEGRRHRPLAPSQKTNYGPKMVPVERHQRGRETNESFNI